MKKYCTDLLVCRTERLSPRHILLRLTDDKPLPQAEPGQFVEVRIDNSSGTFLRRPFSINYVDYDSNELWLLIRMAGEGTMCLSRLRTGDTVNCMLPLGRGFSLPVHGERILLAGGGTGVAPLLYLGYKSKRLGAEPVFLLGAKTRDDLLETDLLRDIGRVCVATEDGSAGECGLVTAHSILGQERFDRIHVCGPRPMMMAMAEYAFRNDTDCEVSLENMMACGLGACLCCVEKTTDGNVCVCKDGPVFNARKLLWRI